MHVHVSLKFLSLNDIVCVCPKVPMRFIQVEGHCEAQVTAHFAQGSSFSHILTQICWFPTTFAISPTILGIA